MTKIKRLWFFPCGMMLFLFSAPVLAMNEASWPVGLEKILSPSFTCQEMEELYSNISGTMVERDFIRVKTRESCRNKVVLDAFKRSDVPFCPGLNTKPQRFSRCFYAIFKTLELRKRITAEGIDQLHIAAIEYLVRNKSKLNADRILLDVLVISLRGMENRLRPDHLTLAARPLDAVQMQYLDKMRMQDLLQAWKSAIRILEQSENILMRLLGKAKMSPPSLRFLEKRKSEIERQKKIWLFNDPARQSRISALENALATGKQPLPPSNEASEDGKDPKKQEDAVLKATEKENFEESPAAAPTSEDDFDEGDDWDGEE